VVIHKIVTILYCKNKCGNSQKEPKLEKVGKTLRFCALTCTCYDLFTAFQQLLWSNSSAPPHLAFSPVQNYTIPIDKHYTQGCYYSNWNADTTWTNKHTMSLHTRNRKTHISGCI